MLAVVRQSARFSLAMGLLLAAAKLAFPQNSQSLKEILTAQGLPLSGAKLANVEKRSLAAPNSTTPINSRSRIIWTTEAEC